MKNQKGITLVAIIITVIVMLILAGVSITTTVGEDGILENSKNAVEDNDVKQSKDCILEAWSYVLAKCENLQPYDGNSEFVTEFNRAKSIFGKYISNYGNGVLENIVINLQDPGNGNVIGYAYKVSFQLSSLEESKIYYIVDDENVFDEEEFSKNYKKIVEKEIESNK